MNILLIGSGGREHALAWKIRQSARCGALWCAPGNPGVAALAQLAPPELARDFAALTTFCQREAIGLVVVGPERPLALGMADALQAVGIAVFGPTQAGAQLEASKTFAKALMAEAGIPTGAAATFTDLPAALAYLEAHPVPIVIKADGLAEGKGVTVARTRAEAEAALRACLSEAAFGAAGASVLIEEFLEGEEVSLLAFTDGTVIKAMDSAQDHKPVGEGDTGPNTGGMGAYSPAPVLTPALRAQAEREVLEPILRALRARGIDYRGVVYAGLIITAAGPKVIEFNCRFGDPETQALLPRLENDLVEVMLACAEGRLAEVDLRWTEQAAVCVVGAAAGYPGAYRKGVPLTLGPLPEGVLLFHAGTARDAAGQLVTAGGRVFGLTALAPTLREAIGQAYAALPQVQFAGLHYRRDIGKRAL